jgi:hypothetical protein
MQAWRRLDIAAAADVQRAQLAVEQRGRIRRQRYLRLGGFAFASHRRDVVFERGPIVEAQLLRNQILRFGEFGW